jgi:gliding motility-associated-like protein
LENLNGCLGTSEVTLEDLITVTPSPNALFNFEPKTISVLDPVIEITDLSEGNILCNYYFDDRVFEDCSFIYEVENLVPQTIRLVVQNEFGCVDEIEAEIFLEDHLIFIPNAFTPDGDGINDLFRPVMEGVLDYQMWIFDRWGSEIFYTDDRRGWDGQGAREDYYLQNQEYTYRIVISEYNQRNYEYFGSVRLIR